MRRTLCAVLFVALAAACGTAEPSEIPTPTPEPTSTPTPEPTPTPTEPPEPVLAPLTGVALEDPAAAERPVLAVKIDNHPAARPQSGLDDADLVVVELVEGVTRFIGLFHSTDPGVVGPVRSGRLVDVDLVRPFDPIFLISGAARVVWPELRSGLPAVYEEGQTPGWFRDRSRRAPHNLYITAEEVWGIDHDGEPIAPFWTFEEDAPDGGTHATSVTAAYPRAGSSGWDWEAGRWVRLQEGAPHSTLDGDRIAADNVAVVRMQPTGAERRPFEPIGEGEATVFRDGQKFEARWQKESRDAHLELLTLDGEPFPLHPGRTWLELLPATGSLTVQGEGQ